MLGRNHRAAPLNHDTFDKWTNPNTWALGLITADGSSGSSVRPSDIKLYNTDLNMLEAFKIVFGLEKKTFINQGIKGRYGKKPLGMVSMSSKKIVGFLQSIRAYGPKEMRNPFWSVPDEFKWSFIKGLFDGDGNVYRGQMSIAGRIDLVSDVYLWMCEQIQKKPNKLYKSTKSQITYYFTFSRPDTIKIFKLLETNTKGTYDSEKYTRLREFAEVGVTA